MVKFLLSALRSVHEVQLFEINVCLPASSCVTLVFILAVTLRLTSMYVYVIRCNTETEF